MISDYMTSLETRFRESDTRTRENVIRERESVRRRRYLLISGIAVIGSLAVGLVATISQLTRALQAERLSSTERDAKDIAIRQSEYAIQELDSLARRRLSEGDFQLSVSMYHLTLRLRQTLFGVHHTETLEAMSTLAESLRVAGRLRESLAVIEQQIDHRSRTQGFDHPDSLRSALAASVVMKDLGEFESAVQRLERGVQHFERVMGRDAPDTLRCRLELAKAYRGLGKLDRAQTVFDAVVDGMMSVMGECFETLHAMSNQAECLSEQNRVDEAIAIFQKVLTSEHPSFPDGSPHRVRIERALSTLRSRKAQQAPE